MSQEAPRSPATERGQKRDRLLQLGEDPYPPTIGEGRKRTVAEKLTERFASLAEGEKARAGSFFLAGRLMRKRDMGKAAFFNIQDESGVLQCYIKREDFPSATKPLNGWELWKLCDIGDIIAVEGYVFKTRRGELSLRLKALRMLCKSLRPLPEKYHGLHSKELKYRFRHLDLIMDPRSREVFKIRSKIIAGIRSFMGKKGFMEVETPVLQPLYGGAEARPFETWFHRLNQKMYLKISPEIYLKKLIVGGFEKIFEIGKNFRNEGLDRSHNPEFTMMEYYEAYTDYEYQMRQFEELICHIAKSVKKEKGKASGGGAIQVSQTAQTKQRDQTAQTEQRDQTAQTEQIKFLYQERELDLSRPWLRISLQDFQSVMETCLVSRKNETALPITFLYRSPIACKPCQKLKEGEVPEKEMPPYRFWREIAQAFQQRKQEEKNIRESRQISSAFWQSLTKARAGENRQDVLLAQKIENMKSYLYFLDSKADLSPFSLKSSPELYHELSLKALELTVEKFFWDPVFITDFPLSVSPLTKKHRSRPGFVERFEPYIAGFEIGNAYTELNDPIDQRRRLESQSRLQKAPSGEDSSPSASLKDDKPSHPVDESFLQALETGMPPTSGVGLGIERLVMILSDQRNIKDAMLFPMLRNKPGS